MKKKLSLISIVLTQRLVLIRAEENRSCESSLWSVGPYEITQFTALIHIQATEETFWKDPSHNPNLIKSETLKAEPGYWYILQASQQTTMAKVWGGEGVWP